MTKDYSALYEQLNLSVPAKEDDKQNTGYSGTPMWKLALERAQRERAQAASGPVVKIPDGFKPVQQVSESVPAVRCLR